MMIRVHRIIENTGVAGPGQRYCLWAQGCKRQCEGCFAVDTWNADGGYLISIDEVIRSIHSTGGIEGITFLGGEPFEQAKKLAIIGKEAKLCGLSVVVFTGYTLKELLKSKNEGFSELLNVTDLLIDGAFQINKKSFDHPWVGSSNQQYIFLTNRYSADDIILADNKIEVRIYPNGKTITNGMGDFSKIQKYLE